MTERQKAIAFADREFSLYVRTRDGNRCIICHKVGDTDCAHYITRWKLSTRWKEENGNSLCRKCHQDDHNGSDDAYGEAIDRLYGDMTSDFLIRAGNQVIKLSTAQIIEIGKAYRYKRALLEE